MPSAAPPQNDEPRAAALTGAFVLAVGALVAGLLWGTALWSVTMGARVDVARLNTGKGLDAQIAGLDGFVWACVVAAPLAMWLLRARVPAARTVVVLLGTSLTVVILRFTTGPGASLAISAAAICAALLVGRMAGAAWGRFVAPRVRTLFFLAAAIPGAVGALLYAVWSVRRHEQFGSGAWDYGCHVHNIWLFANFKPWVTSVLGDANFWGGTNHFMPSLVLIAPLAWTGATWALAAVQAIVIGATVVPLALLAQRRALGPAALFGICCAFVFHVGTQSTANFDVHENVPVPLFLLLAIWAFETNRRGLAWFCLVVVFGTKESSILYVAAVGGYLVLFMRGRRLEGAGIAVVSLAGFFFVTGWMQPHFLEAGAKMIHAARFAAFGETLAQGAVNMLLHPGKALVVLFSPEQKTETLLVTFGTFSFLPLASPEALLLAAPNLVERFLSDKREMWGLGFHYSIVLVGLSAFGTVTALARLQGALRRHWPDMDGAIDAASGTALVLCAIGVAAFASPIGVELSTLDKGYFSSPAQVEINRRAVRFVPDDASVVAQNHFLPHLALREHIWLPEDRFVKKAEYVVLNPTESPWPHGQGDVVRLTQRLLDDPTFHVVFSEGTTIIFSRRGEPAVAPTSELLKAVGRTVPSGRSPAR